MAGKVAVGPYIKSSMTGSLELSGTMNKCTDTLSVSGTLSLQADLEAGMKAEGVVAGYVFDDQYLASVSLKSHATTDISASLTLSTSDTVSGNASFGDIYINANFECKYINDEGEEENWSVSAFSNYLIVEGQNVTL